MSCLLFLIVLLVLCSIVIIFPTVPRNKISQLKCYCVAYFRGMNKAIKPLLKYMKIITIPFAFYDFLNRFYLNLFLYVLTLVSSMYIGEFGTYLHCIILLSFSSPILPFSCLFPFVLVLILYPTLCLIHIDLSLSLSSLSPKRHTKVTLDNKELHVDYPAVSSLSYSFYTVFL